jgi:hypothetical protein
VATPTAIETQWGGWLFRSRLEARWAVLFDYLKIAFQHEPEGFEFPDGSRYLPDFYLPQVKMFAEVKPVNFTDEEKNKCKMLCDSTMAPCLYLVGPPDFSTYWATHAIQPEIQDRYETDYLLDIDWHNRRLYNDEHRFFGNCKEYWHGNLTELAFTDPYREAVHLSRSIRFDGSRW